MTPSRDVAGARKEPEPARRYPLLVRVAGRWLCRHQLADHAAGERPRDRA